MKEGLEKASGFLRGQLGRRSRFATCRNCVSHDDSAAEAQRISDLIDNALHARRRVDEWHAVEDAGRHGGRPVAAEQAAGHDVEPGVAGGATAAECQEGRAYGQPGPVATGMLPLCFGEATKVCAYLLDADKTYRVTARLGGDRHR